MDSASASKAAILIVESGALWPGPMLDSVRHVSVVSQGSRGTAERLVLRAREAARRCALRRHSLGCIFTSFADAPTPSGPSFRETLVRGLGALVLEIGCPRFVLAAYHVQRMDLADLLKLARAAPFNGSEQIEICFHRAGQARRQRERWRAG